MELAVPTTTQLQGFTNAWRQSWNNFGRTRKRAIHTPIHRDMQNPEGGVRGVIPEKRIYRRQ
jgi:hypothetical protein